jgi:hypothetical protein
VSPASNNQRLGLPRLIAGNTLVPPRAIRTAVLKTTRFRALLKALTLSNTAGISWEEWLTEQKQ